MTHNKDLLEELSSASSSKVRVGNRNYIVVKGKGTIAISTCWCAKFNFDVLYVLEIDQNLVSVWQLIERGYKILFQNESCLIKDAKDKFIFKIKMRGKNFASNPFEGSKLLFKSKRMTQIFLKRLFNFDY